MVSGYGIRQHKPRGQWGKDFFMGKGRWSGGSLVRKILLLKIGWQLQITKTLGRREFYYMCIWWSVLVWKEWYSKPHRFIEVTLHGGFSLHPLHTFIPRKGNGSLCFRKTELLRCSFYFAQSHFSSFLLFHFWMGHKSVANELNWPSYKDWSLQTCPVKEMCGTSFGGCWGRQGEVGVRWRPHSLLHRHRYRLPVSGQADTHLSFHLPHVRT